MVDYFKKPIFLSTVICILLLFFNIIKTDYKINTNIISANNISVLCCKILSSPSKSSSGKTYSAKVRTIYSGTEDGCFADFNQNINVYIPVNMVEAFMPGKLYSEAKEKGAFLYETGEICTFHGKFTELGFIVDNCYNCYWQNDYKGKIAKLRALCRLQFKRLMFAWGNAGGLLLALLCGAREYTDPLTAASFKNAGLSHILALSGMHLSMFSAIAIFIGDKVGRKKLTYIIRIIALSIFVWFAGFSPSLLRAFICAMLVLFSSVASVNQPDMILILCFSFLSQCVISPQDISNSGFLLSYSALAGILILNKVIFKLYIKLFPTLLSASLSSSTAANIFTAPISIKLFGSFSPIGIIATTFVSPLITVFIYAGLILIILNLIFPILVVPSGNFMNILYTIIDKMVSIFSIVPSIKFK